WRERITTTASLGTLCGASLRAVDRRGGRGWRDQGGNEREQQRARHAEDAENADPAANPPDPHDRTIRPGRAGTRARPGRLPLHRDVTAHPERLVEPAVEEVAPGRGQAQGDDPGGPGRDPDVHVQRVDGERVVVGALVL